MSKTKRRSSYPSKKSCSYCGSKTHYTQSCSYIRADRKKLFTHNRLYRAGLLSYIRDYELYPAAILRIESTPFPNLLFDTDIKLVSLWMIVGYDLSKEYVNYTDVSKYKISNTTTYKKIRGANGKYFNSVRYIGPNVKLESVEANVLRFNDVLLPHLTMKVIPMSIELVDSQFGISLKEDLNQNTMSVFDIETFYNIIPVARVKRRVGAITGTFLYKNADVKENEWKKEMVNRSNDMLGGYEYRLPLFSIEHFNSLYADSYGSEVYSKIVSKYLSELSIKLMLKQQDNAISQLYSVRGVDYHKLISNGKIAELPFVASRFLTGATDKDPMLLDSELLDKFYGVTNINDWLLLKDKAVKRVLWRRFKVGYDSIFR